MQTTLFTTLAVAATMASLAHGFVITDINSGAITNFGDNKCQIWTGNPFSFESDAGCTLYAYSEGNCQGSIFQTATQNAQQTAPDGIISINCET